MTEPRKRIFWMVWREYGGTPTHRHATKASAVAEAERLASLNPGNAFFVLKSTAARVADKPQVRAVQLTSDELGDDGIPF